MYLILSNMFIIKHVEKILPYFTPNPIQYKVQFLSQGGMSSSMLK
jgi:hypothetical protein